MSEIKVLVVDDHDMVLLGVKTLLSSRDDIKIVGVAKNGEDAILKIAELKPDVVILDIDLPDMSGLEVAKRLIASSPLVKILFHTAFMDEKHIVEGFETGAMGYVPKNFQPEEFIDAIKTVNNGDKYLKGSVSEIFLKSYFKAKDEKILSLKYNNLTKREIEILKLVGAGVPNTEIAKDLFISTRTVEAHKANIMGKLNINTTVELVKFAIKNKLVVL
ncbi:MAG: response regulator transcription factor [Bacteroidota bacterium]